MIPPVVRSVLVSWDQAAAFHRFAEQFGAWWPKRTHSVGGERVKAVILEPKVGGRIFEEHVDGRRFQWGTILEWDPPRQLTFTFHPARDASTAQDVVVRFIPERDGTKVELTASNWERWGDGATRARRGYNLGWGYILNDWAGKRTVGMALLSGVGAVRTLIQKLRGGTAATIAKSGGEIAGANADPA